MGIKNFIHNGIQTSKKIYEAGAQKINDEQISFIKFFGSALKQTSLGVYYVFIKSELDQLSKQNQITEVINSTSQQVTYLIGGYFLSPASLLPLKQELENHGLQVKIINNRYYSLKTLHGTVKNLKNQLKKDRDKNIVLFGYSSGGIIAHKIGDKSGYNSVSYGVPEKPTETMVGTLVSLTKKSNLNDVTIPETGINIIEGFSAMVPQTQNQCNNIVKLNDIYSHATIGKT